MKFIGRLLMISPLFGPSVAQNMRGSSFYERMLGPDTGALCVNNPVCVAMGLVEGACCPNSNQKYLDCCNRECSVHPNCHDLGGLCCPTIHNVDLNCCDHNPALASVKSESLTSPTPFPTSNPSESPSALPSASPSERPSEAPSRSPSACPSSHPSVAPSASPTEAQAACPSSASQFASSIETLTTSGGNLTFDIGSLPRAIGSTKVFVEVFLRGDFGQTSEFMEAYGENNTLIGTIDPDVECTKTYHSHVFAIKKAVFNSWLRDDHTVTLILDASTSVGTFCPDNDAYVVLCYETAPVTTPSPSESPSISPSDSPSVSPSESPTSSPSASPSDSPTTSPFVSPSGSPSEEPSTAPPTGDPTSSPSGAPSGSPTASPSSAPTGGPTASPSSYPSDSPSTSNPSSPPSALPTTATPSTTAPTDDDNDGDRTDDNGGGDIVVPVDPWCSANPGCAALGLTGYCCPPLHNNGKNLDCCTKFGGNPMAACSANFACDQLGLAGNCCPTYDGVQLDCCGGIGGGGIGGSSSD